MKHAGQQSRGSSWGQYPTALPRVPGTIRHTLFTFLLFLTTCPVFASFDFNENCVKAYRSIIQLRFDEASVLLAEEKKRHPGNDIVVLLENYIDYFSIFTSGDKSLYDELQKRKKARLSRLMKGDRDSPWYLFSLAEINLQWALTRLYFNDYYPMAFEIKRADDYYRQGISAYPDFLPYYKGQGVLQVMIGSAPSGVQTAMKILGGVKGSVSQGMRLLQQAIRGLPDSEYPWFYEENLFYYSYTMLVFAGHDKAYEKTARLLKPYTGDNLLLSYMLGHIAMQTAHTDEAIRVLQQRPSGTAYTSFPYMDYLLGVAKLNRLDEDAPEYLQKFLSESKGSNYIKDAWLRIGWSYLLKGDAGRYQKALQRVRSRGNTYMERDIQAGKEASAGGTPDLSLLKARLYFDGGYYEQALDALEKVSGLRDAREKLELTYRRARIYDEMGSLREAVKYYKITLEKGRNETWYFAANSALMLGEIYEHHKDYERAAHYYRECISMKGHEYQNSIESKARAGLSRVQ